MAAARTLTVYTDYKSPYAYLAKDLVYQLESDFPVQIDWLPYVLDIPAYLGSARIDAGGRVIEESRNAHQWRRVRYSYMDCRRQARKRGLIVRGTQKIWDSTLAARGLLYAKRQGATVLRHYNDLVFERFWKRELDIEDPAVIEGAGDHCCEYMTGGVVCVLGRTGVNFGAGFTGGFAYVLDLERDFVDRYNHELIDISRIHAESMQSHLQHLQSLLEQHVAETGSAWAEEIVNDLRSYIGKFWVVKPKAASIDSLIENLRRAA